MDRRVVAAVSYILAVMIGLEAAWVVLLMTVLIVPKEPLPGPHPAAPFIFIGALLVTYAMLGAVFAFALPSRSWVAYGVCLGASGSLLYRVCWWFAGPSRTLLTDVLVLATPLFAACIGAYAGAWLRRPRQKVRGFRAKEGIDQGLENVGRHNGSGLHPPQCLHESCCLQGEKKGRFGCSGESSVPGLQPR